MMDKEKTIQRINRLIDTGSQALKTEELTVVTVANFKIGSLSFLSKIAGENSNYYKEFKEQCNCYDDNQCYYMDVQKGLGILEAFKDDVENGYLQKFEDIVAADIFSDFIEMADHLLDNKYHHPAASLLGAVLEDSLRKICKKNDINIGKESSSSLSKLNKLLCDKKIYNKITFKQVDACTAIRNQADHGRFKEIKLGDVKKMSEDVQRFLSEYL